MERIMIDNCVITKFTNNGISIMPISLIQKINPLLDLNSINKKTFGSRKQDNLILTSLADGTLKFDDLFSNSFIDSN